MRVYRKKRSIIEVRKVSRPIIYYVFTKKLKSKYIESQDEAKQTKVGLDEKVIKNTDFLPIIM